MTKNVVKGEHCEPIKDGRPEPTGKNCHCGMEPIDHVDALEDARCEVVALSEMLPPLLRSGGIGGDVVLGIRSLLDSISDVIEEARASFENCLRSHA